MSENFREESRKQWNSNVAGVTEMQIAVGCLQRIADATEAMAKEYNRLLSEAKYLRTSRDEHRDCSERLARKNAALRGTITRMKRAAHPTQ